MANNYTAERLRFHSFQHPYVCTFVEELARSGVDGLLRLSNQWWERDNKSHKDMNEPTQQLIVNALGKGVANYFDYRYKPNTDIVSTDFPSYWVDFDLTGTYSQYNWELFFHIPLFVATQLMQDQRHEEAMRWFHYIFNPMTDDPAAVPQRYWNFKPFRDLGVPERIQDLLWTLQDPKADNVKKEEVETAIKEWRRRPFEPHRIARGRPGAYMKNVVMKYLDNVIAWGDKLFRRDTIESINEATQLYILAANLVRVRPPRVPPVVKEEGGPPTYRTLRKTLDDFSNGVVKVESLLPFSAGSGGNGTPNGEESLLGLGTLAFCIPPNDTLLSYWDTVEDRLFKIRHCMNIEGVVRELSLFEPPIDPALLVRATAMGLDLSQVLDDLAAPMPHYRFTFMLQKAREFCDELKQIGGLLLSTLEKKDAEKLAQTRAMHEKALLKAIREVKKKQIEETKDTLASLEQSHAQAVLRQKYYSSRAFTIPGEKAQLDLLLLSTVLQTAGQALQLGASFAHAWPDQFVGAVGGTTGGGALYFNRVAGGSPAGSALQAEGRAMEILAGVAQAAGSASGILAGYRRRADDWKLQADLAATEMKQLDQQIAAADIRQKIAEDELANHEKQIEQAEEIEDFLRDKFTNQDLYNWMWSQVSAVYFQAYKLAYDLAKRAERVYRHELGITDSAFIPFGNWDNLRQGLLAGEKLSLDLRRLEHAYLEQNKREYEITKHVSLLLNDPWALMELKTSGRCEVDLPELLFDADYPGHYFRRIKNVTLNIPCVVGPYTSINCTLTLLKSKVRVKPSAGTGESAAKEYVEKVGEDGRFTYDLAPLQRIATSQAQNDSGLFELSFRDERYLPFECVGAISTWRIELPADNNAFDVNSVSDVVLTIRYTAREGGDLLRSAARGALDVTLASAENVSLYRLFSARHEFPDEWYKFLHPISNDAPKLSLPIDRSRFPYLFSRPNVTITYRTAAFFVKMAPDKSGPNTLGITTPLGVAANLNLTKWKSLSVFKASLPQDGEQWTEKLDDDHTVWKIAGQPALSIDSLEDVFLLLGYAVSKKTLV